MFSEGIFEICAMLSLNHIPLYFVLNTSIITFGESVKRLLVSIWLWTYQCFRGLSSDGSNESNPMVNGVEEVIAAVENVAGVASDEGRRCAGDVEKGISAKRRVRSLDAFRGVSITIMIFVNYGGGGYW